MNDNHMTEHRVTRVEGQLLDLSKAVLDMDNMVKELTIS